MMKVLFVCLLSLSLCLSAPQQAKDAAPPSPSSPQVAVGTLDVNGGDNKGQVTAGPGAIAVDNKVPTPVAVNETAKIENATETKPNDTSAANSNKTALPNASVDPKDEKIDNKAPSSVPASTANAAVPADNATKPSNVTNPTIVTTDEPNPKPNPPITPATTTVVTPKPTDKTTVTTEAPTKSTPSPGDHPAGTTPVKAARGFDGPSFIGGIVLALGLLAMGFMGFKYYKSQTERNYHTL